MPSLIRKFFSKLNGNVASRFAPSRRAESLPIRIMVEPDRNTGRLVLNKSILSIKGETKDMSTSGIAFWVDSIRLREHYLVGEGRVLKAEIDLPSGKIGMQIVGQRYEQVDIHLSVSKYLIGATIVNIGPAEKEAYEDYLRNGGKIKKDITPTLGLEVTKS